MDFFKKIFDSDDESDDILYRGEFFDVQFTQQTLGMTCASYSKKQAKNDKIIDIIFDNDPISLTRAIITSIHPSSEANELNLYPGDIIISIDQNFIQYDNFVAVVSALPRPCLCHIYRPKKSILRKNYLKKKKSEDKNTSNNNNNFFSKFQNKNEKEILTEEEREERRLARIEAANKRSNKWDEKLSRRKKERYRNEQNKIRDNNDFQPSNSIDTQRVVNAVKKSEEKTTQLMGYNPFQPHISTGNRAGSTTTASNMNNNINETNLLPPNLNTNLSISSTSSSNNNLDISQNDMNQINSTLSSIKTYSLENNLNDEMIIAFQTIYKMIKKILKNPEEDKYRKIRLSNETFQRKVTNISGTTEFLLTCGFELINDEEDNESYLIFMGNQDILIYARNQLKDLL